jgi:hypothetical protein
MNGYAAQGSGSGASTAPVVAGGQGTPQAPAQPGTPQTITIPLGASNEQIRDIIRNQVRDALRNGQNPTINIDPGGLQNAVPTGVVDISVAFFVTLAVIIVGTPIARALARRMDSRSRALEEQGRQVGPQMAALQESVDAMAVELERISEAQRFQSQLLAGKAPQAAKIER